MLTLFDTEFAFDQLHFHWGSGDDQGSEHSVDGVFFPLEMHMVHVNSSFEDFDAASDQPGGLAVISFLFELGEVSSFAMKVNGKKYHTCI